MENGSQELHQFCTIRVDKSENNYRMCWKSDALMRVILEVWLWMPWAFQQCQGWSKGWVFFIACWIYPLLTSWESVFLVMPAVCSWDFVSGGFVGVHFFNSLWIWLVFRFSTTGCSMNADTEFESGRIEREVFSACAELASQASQCIDPSHSRGAAVVCIARRATSWNPVFSRLISLGFHCFVLGSIQAFTPALYMGNWRTGIFYVGKFRKSHFVHCLWSSRSVVGLGLHFVIVKDMLDPPSGFVRS